MAVNGFVVNPECGFSVDGIVLDEETDLGPDVLCLRLGCYAAAAAAAVCVIERKSRRGTY